ncbi:MAG: CBS domain-containing protein [Verrucomicrobia bacterium]|nr:CBS domain-containing protein [Verrucomicrobiota bacterium]
MQHFLAFGEEATIEEVLRGIGAEADEDSDLEVQYAYAIDREGVLTGVLPVLDLVRTSWKRKVREVMISKPLSVRVDTPLQDLRRIFDEKAFLGLPVVDEAGRMCGVLSRGRCGGRRARSRRMPF